MLKVLIVDDEQPARSKLIRLLAADARFCVVGEAQDGVEALTMIESLQPDVVILDIQMPGLNGFELLASLEAEPNFAIVFCTAYDSYALQAFDAHAVDYLLKPYDEARFRKALEKATAQRAASSGREAMAMARKVVQATERLALKSVEGPWLSLELDRVVSLSAANKYTCIRTLDGEHIVREPLRSLESRLDARFVCTHRSEIVHVGAVLRVEPEGYGDARLILRDGSSASLARSRRKTFFEQWSKRVG